jgi:ATP-dependent protease ClpP protease subunit
MSADEAKDYGLIDNVIVSRELVAPEVIAAQAAGVK